MDAAPPNKDDLIEQFCSFTDASRKEAADCLLAHSWDVELSVSTWFAAQEGGTDEEVEEQPEASTAPEAEASSTSYVAGGGRTLAGGFVPPPAAAASSSAQAPSNTRRAPARTGPRTIKDLQGYGHAHEDDSEDEDTDMFAGGEKSGLAVQNPGSNNPQDQINKIMDRARRNVPRPGGDEPEPQRQSYFTGRGVTLGGEGQESRVVIDPAPRREVPRVSRTLHLWSEGFSVDDGDLFRYDDPANAATMAMIQQGRAPLELLNVEHGQQVDLQLDDQKGNTFRRPRKKYPPFAGSGVRLGSLVPINVTRSPPAATQSSSTQYPSDLSATAGSTPIINDGQATITLQIRLGDGERLQARFNRSQTIGDVYAFVNAASPPSQQRTNTLMTTFPNRELHDPNVKLSELPGFERGGYLIQKWT